MTPDQARKKDAAERNALLTEVWLLPRDDKIALIRAAKAYRSGSDSCNSVYMGGMATHSLMLALGGGANDPLEARLAASNARQLDKALEVCAPYIIYMRANPRKKCPCCGQVVPA